ncbi:MAG: efflux RND transporter permease subunit, partial [Acidobacteriaceae bacterium]
SNTITIVKGIRERVKHLLDVPRQLKARVVFDQSIFVKMAVNNVIHEGGIGLLLTAIMILLFLGNLRATVAVMLSIPLSVLAGFLLLNAAGNTINTMVLGGLALALSRLIDNSVIVLENIFRHMEMGEEPMVAAEQGGKEVDLAVLAATVSTSIVFFPVVLLTGVSKYLFTALALGVVLAMFASYLVAMTVIPLFCAKFIRLEGYDGHETSAEPDESGASELLLENSENEQMYEQKRPSIFKKIVGGFNRRYHRLEGRYDRGVDYCLRRPVFVTVIVAIFVAVSLSLYPFLNLAFFPRTDPGQFVINFKAPPGTRLELTDHYSARIENIIRQMVPPSELNMIVSNIGVYPDLSAIYTTNTAMDNAFVQVSLKKEHKVGSYVYMSRVRQRLRQEIPDIETYFQTGGLVDSVVNQGKPAPFDIRISTMDLKDGYAIAKQIAEKVHGLILVSDTLVPQDVNYPGLELNVNREHAAFLGLTEKNVVDGVITALTSNGMIAPSYWIDPKSGNNYMLTVQYYNSQIQTMKDFKEIPLRAEHSVAYLPPGSAESLEEVVPPHDNIVPLESVADIKYINTPTVVDHYQLRRVFDVYIMPTTEDLGRVGKQIDRIVAKTHPPAGTLITIGGSITDMRESFHSFATGLTLAVVLIYLVLMAQFASFSDPFVILLAVPPGVAGVVLTLLITGSSLNIMSLMGLLMMTGMAVSNSILIVEFVGKQRQEGKPLKTALAEACRFRLRPIIMTTLATVLGIIPMSLGLEAGSEQYAPLARALLGGVLVSAVVSVFLVPTVYYLIHRKQEQEPGTGDAPELEART